MTPPRSHHDRVFRCVFSRPESMHSLLEVALPEGVNELEPESLKRTPDAFVAAKLTELQGDLVFSARLRGREAFLYALLLEHQRYDNPLAAFRALRGSTHLWEWWLGEHPGADRLPAVVPILVSQLGRPWSGMRRLSELVDLPADALATVRDHQADLELVVFDLADHSHAELAHVADLVARVTLALMKARAERASPEEVLRLHREASRAVFEDPRLADEQIALSAYIIAAWDLDPGRFVEVIRKGADVDLQQDMLDLIFETGERKGLEKGLEKGLGSLRSTLVRLLEARFGPVTPEHRARIEAASAPELEEWAVRVLSARSADEALG